jgi:hypothetical protein
MQKNESILYHFKYWLIEEIGTGKKSLSAHTPALPCVTFGRMEPPQVQEKILTQVSFLLE